MPFKDSRVLQIMPSAPDWRAAFADENEEGLIIETQLAGWALIERTGGGQAVVGFDAVGEAESCEALENFLGYVAPGEPASRWHREAVKYFQELARSAPQPLSSGPLDVVERLHRAIERHDWATVAVCYHQDVEYSDPDVSLRGRERVVERAKQRVGPFLDVSIERTDEIACGDGVSVAWRFHGRNDERLVLPSGVEMPATGKTVDLPGVSLFHLSNGVIASERSAWDNGALYHQLGLLPDPALFGTW